LEKRAELVLPGSEAGKGRSWGTEGRNDPNNASRYEYMNKKFFFFEKEAEDDNGIAYLPRVTRLCWMGQ
jgi:hypothetical protein